MTEIGDFLVKPTVLVAIFLGGSALLLGYILRLFRDYQQDEEKPIRSDKGSGQADRKKESYPVTKPKKKPSESRYRADKHGFTSPWVLTTLKGHTGPVLNVDYSSNGKYLASCGEEDPDPDPEDCDMNTDASSISSSSSSDGNKENSPPSSSSPSPRLQKGLTRRQRKNRRREESSPDAKKKQSQPTTTIKSATAPSPSSPPKWRQLNITTPCGRDMNERQFVEMLYRYLVSLETMAAWGYPTQTTDNQVYFMNHSYNVFADLNEQPFDVNAEEFIPRHVRNGSTDSESSRSDDVSPAESMNELGIERVCARCARGFFITSSDYLTHEKCLYHWGKLHTVFKKNLITGIVQRSDDYSCCFRHKTSRGCTTSKLHVWSGVVDGLNGPYDGFVRTKPRKTPLREGESYGVYALDCEMSYTVAGLEVTKVTVVAMDGKIVYDTYVKPTNEVVDYNTRYSGITAADLNCKSKGNIVKSLKEVQDDLRDLISAQTVLIGHGLENDLRALKLVHYACVDTAFVFPHKSGLPSKRSLKTLVRTHLKRDVQNGCHDSYEDACGALELMQWKIRNDLKRMF